MRKLAGLERLLTGQSAIGGLYSRHFTRINSSKIAFLSRYKFTIAFENSSYPGYTTEKIYHPMVAGSLPVYWGNPQIHREFNPKSFVNHHDFANEDEVIERIVEIDRNDGLYKKYLQEPWLHGNEPNQFMDLLKIKSRLQEICG
jgi:hypothetical protein